MNEGALNIFKRLGGTVNAFQSQTTGWKVNVTLLVSIKKEIRCAWCLKSFDCINIESVDVFKS